MTKLANLLLYATLAVFAPIAVAAQVTMQNCLLVVEEYTWNPRLVCLVNNESEQSIAWVAYGFTLTIKGRSVPLFEVGTSRSGFSARAAYSFVPNGIEPGETLEVRLRQIDLPQDVDPENVRLEVQLHHALDIERQPIE